MAASTIWIGRNDRANYAGPRKTMNWNELTRDPGGLSDPAREGPPVITTTRTPTRRYPDVGADASANRPSTSAGVVSNEHIRRTIPAEASPNG